MILPIVPYSEQYYPSKETIEFFLWMNSNFTEDNKSAVAHYRIIDHINSTTTKYKGLMASRGLSKTTLVGVYYMAFLLWKGKKPNINTFRSAIYVMDTITKAKQVLRRVIDLIQDNPNLFGSKFKIIRTNLADDPMLEIYHHIEKRKMWFFVRGTGQSLRGTNVKERPDLIVFDDIESEQNAGTPEAREKNLIWFFANAIPAGRMDDTEFVFIGTPIHKKSILMILADEDGSGKKQLLEMGFEPKEIPEWHFLKLPVAEKFPVDEDEEIISAWEDRFPPQSIKRTHAMYSLVGKETLFFQEYMLELAASGVSVYDIEKIKYINTDDLRKILEVSTIYLSIDIRASDKVGDNRLDYTSISVIAIHNETGHWFLVDNVFGHLSTDDALNYIFNLYKKYRCVSLVMEQVAFQTLFKYILEKEMAKRRYMINIETISRSNTNKLSVFKQFSAIVNNGAFWINDDLDRKSKDELIDEEMKLITQDAILAEHDDLLDSVAQLVLIELDMPENDIIFDDDSYIDEWSNPYEL